MALLGQHFCTLYIFKNSLYDTVIVNKHHLIDVNEGLEV
jgi:hypothetical protein